MATSKSPFDVVCDAGPLIHLGELDCLDLLEDFAAVLVPEQVWREVERHRPASLLHPDVALQRISVSLSEDASFHAVVRALTLDLGEQAALSLMEQHSDAILLTDDAAARLAARALGYRAHGTIGILLRAMRRQYRTLQEVLSLLRGLPTRSSLYVRSELLEDIIKHVESTMTNQDG